MDRLFWSLLLCFTASWSLRHDELSDSLHGYELIHMNSIRTRTKRHVDPHNTEDFHQIWLSTHGRQFHLKLQKSKILSKDFKTVIVHGNGKTKEFTDNNHGNHEFYSGKLADDKSSIVNVYWEEDALTASIITAEDIYFIEPLWRYLKTSDKMTLLAYKKSNIKFPKISRSFCAARNNATSSTQTSHSIKEETHTRRQRRDTDFGDRKLCRLILVADYHFFSTAGMNSVLSTQNYMIGVIDRVNRIYQPTKWPDDSSALTGLGFEILAIIVHDQPTAVDDGLHYNMANRKMDTSTLLTYFGKEFYQNRACLIHLFTNDVFSDGNLGIAYIASWRYGDYGGICSSSKRESKEAYNVGLTTLTNKYGNRVLTLQSSITTAHEMYVFREHPKFTGKKISELAHNWGSQHDDPDDSRCSPSEFDGGNYIMYPSSQEGYSSNNVLFSPCSRRSIYQVLKAKGFSCFRAANPFLAVCGNGKVEGLEKCDSGGRHDPCCNKFCQFTSGSDCSPYNQACCWNCHLANTSTVCVSSIDDNFDCQNTTHCDGYNYVCPAPVSKKDDTPCHDGGYCKNGKCEGFCEYRKMLPCICSKESGHSCHRCCKKSKDAACEFFDHLLEDGRTCYQGYCEKGVCLKQASTAVKFWSYLTTEIINSFDVFMRDNSVFFITLFSTILWLLGVTIFNYLDKTQEEKDKPLRKRHYELMESVTLPEDEDKVKLVKTNLSRIKQKRLQRLFSEESQTPSYGVEQTQSRFGNHNSFHDYHGHADTYNQTGYYGSFPTAIPKQVYNSPDDTWQTNFPQDRGLVSHGEYLENSFGDGALSTSEKRKKKIKPNNERVRPEISWPVTRDDDNWENQLGQEFSNVNDVGYLSSHSMPFLTDLSGASNLQGYAEDRTTLYTDNQYLPYRNPGVNRYSTNTPRYYDNRSGQFPYGHGEIAENPENIMRSFNDCDDEQRLMGPRQHLYGNSLGFTPIMQRSDHDDDGVFYSNPAFARSKSDVADPVRESYI